MQNLLNGIKRSLEKSITKFLFQHLYEIRILHRIRIYAILYDLLLTKSNTSRELMKNSSKSWSRLNLNRRTKTQSLDYKIGFTSNLTVEFCLGVNQSHGKPTIIETKSSAMQLEYISQVVNFLSLQTSQIYLLANLKWGVWPTFDQFSTDMFAMACGVQNQQRIMKKARKLRIDYASWESR